MLLQKSKLPKNMCINFPERHSQNSRNLRKLTKNKQNTESTGKIPKTHKAAEC